MEEQPVNLYIGIDISKASHYVAFLSTPLLAKNKRYTACPAHRVGNERREFEKLLAEISAITPPGHCSVCLERTGHYGFALEQFLLEHGISVYRVQASKGQYDKTDKRDAQRLALAAYNQLELRAHVPDSAQVLRRLIAPQPIYAFLRPLVHHRAELVRESTRRRNQLTALIDESFPEFTEVYKDPNTLSALQMRAAYPTPETILAASVDDLCKARPYTHPSRLRLMELRDLARTSIGVRGDRLRSLVIEQRQLIDCLLLLYKQIDEVETLIEETITPTREGCILMSFPGVGTISAAILMSYIDSIAHFDNPKKLRSFLGWAPRREQTGTTKDQTILPKRRGSLLKSAIYLIVFNGLKVSPAWQILYEHYCEKLCPLDERTGEYKEKRRAMTRIISGLIDMMYLLLRRDYELVTSWNAEEPLPDPELYDGKRHLARVEARYKKMKQSA